MFNFGFLLESGGSGFATFAILGVLILFFVFMSRSQKKRDRADQQMRDSLQVGDEVTTIGGIIGKVVSIKAETFVLETTKDKTKIRFLKGAIRSVDVRAADIAATLLETDATDDNAPIVDEAPAEAKKGKKNGAIEQAPLVDEAPAEVSEKKAQKELAKQEKKELKEKKMAEKKAAKEEKAAKKAAEKAE